jgi:hypothetical protein
MSSEVADSARSLANSQRELLRGALRSGDNSAPLTSLQREAIREICIQAGDRAKKPEGLLIAFKAALSEAANEVKLPVGEERSALLARYVSAFIEELYSVRAPTRTVPDADSNGTGPVTFTPTETHGLSDAHL